MKPFPKIRYKNKINVLHDFNVNNQFNKMAKGIQDTRHKHLK